MPEKPIPSREDKRRVWDLTYREKNREQRRAYDRERMRRLRGEQNS